MQVVSSVGMPLPFLPLLVAVCGVLWRWHGRLESLLVCGSTLGGFALGLAVKETVRTPRPAAELERTIFRPFVRYAFPSVHVISYVSFFGSLGYLAARRWRGRPYRWPVVLVAGSAIALIGPSRVYLGVHRPSDVLAGYLMGHALVVAGAFVLDRLSNGEASGEQQRCASNAARWSAGRSAPERRSAAVPPAKNGEDEHVGTGNGSEVAGVL